MEDEHDALPAPGEEQRPARPGIRLLSRPARAGVGQARFNVLHEVAIEKRSGGCSPRLRFARLRPAALAATLRLLGPARRRKQPLTRTLHVKLTPRPRVFAIVVFLWWPVKGGDERNAGR